jgi:membrane-associated protease RseP (regulator of RpoE activity)
MFFTTFVENFTLMKRILFLISFFCISSLSFGQQPASVCELGFSYTISRQNNWGFSKPVVTSVHIGSPAEKAGLKINDIIERIDGQPSDRYYSDAIFALLHEERYIKLIVSNLGYRNKELIFSKDCDLMDAVSEKQMASDLAPYSLGNVEEKVFIRNFKTTVTQSPQINFLNYKTFGFKENAHQNNSDKFLNNRIKMVLEKRGLIYSAKNPNLFISTNVLSYKEGEEFVRITISFIDPRYSTEEEPYIIWQCTAKDYEIIPDSDISLMLMQYPFPQTFDEARFRHFKKKYNYTGIIYDMNNFRKIFYVDPVSPASLAGVETGDVILKINNIKMVENFKRQGYNKVFSYLFDFKPYQINFISFKLKRGKKQFNIQVEPITMEYEQFEIF